MPTIFLKSGKSKLVADFRAVYRGFADVSRSMEPEALGQLVMQSGPTTEDRQKRIVRQTCIVMRPLPVYLCPLCAWVLEEAPPPVSTPAPQLVL